MLTRVSVVAIRHLAIYAVPVVVRNIQSSRPGIRKSIPSEASDRTVFDMKLSRISNPDASGYVLKNGSWWTSWAWSTRPRQSNESFEKYEYRLPWFLLGGLFFSVFFNNPVLLVLTFGAIVIHLAYYDIRIVRGMIRELRSGSGRNDEAITTTLELATRGQRIGVSNLVKILKGCDFDGGRLNILRIAVNRLIRRLDGKCVIRILETFDFDSYRLEALELLIPVMEVLIGNEVSQIADEFDFESTREKAVERLTRGVRAQRKGRQAE